MKLKIFIKKVKLGHFCPLFRFTSFMIPIVIRTNCRIQNTSHHSTFHTLSVMIDCMILWFSGISAPRQTSVTGVPLPSARLISATVHPDISNLHNRYTLMVMQVAQFVDHDLTFTPVQRGQFCQHINNLFKIIQG